MEMQFKNEIKKLADVIVWADNWIEELKTGLTEEELEEDTEIEEFEAVKKAVLSSMERHTVYTNALNKDIADKAAKIELLEKEIEGRKEGYVALKEKMDTEYMPIDEHNDVCKAYEKKVAELEKESEKWQDLAKMNRDTICNQYDVCEDFKKKIAELEEKVKHQRANLDGINKTLEIRTKENETLIAVKKNQEKEIEGHESENARLTERIIYYKNQERIRTDQLRATESKVEELYKQIDYLKKELEETCTTKDLDLKGHNRREMALVNELADKNDEIKGLKEENSYLKSEIKQKQNIIKKAYERYSDEIIKTRKDVLEVAYREIEKDNGYVGFKLYVKNALTEAKGNKEEANEAITEVIKFAYREWDERQKENEKTIEKAIKEVKNKRNESDIPCDEDSVE